MTFTATSQTPPAQVSASPSVNPFAIVAAVFLVLWLVTMVLLVQSGGWLVSQIMLALGLDLPGYVWPVLGVVAAVLTAGPALLLAFLPSHPALRETGRAWVVGGSALGVGSALRAIPGTENEWYLLALTACAAAAAALLRRNNTGGTGISPAFGAMAGLVVLLPFLWAGALGGLLETTFSVLAAIAVGVAATVVLDRRFWEAFGASRARRIWVGGLIAGVFLALLAGGVGGNGVQLLLVLVMPPLGFAAAALGPAASRAMLALAAWGPLAFVDPVEVNIFLLDRDVPFWVTVAAAVSWLLALVIGLASGLAGNVLARARRAVAVTAAAVLTLGAGAVYTVAGQPGFYGDRLFVVLKDQADLSGIPPLTGTGPERDHRVEAVYQQLVWHAELTQAELRTDLDRWRLSYRPYYLVNAIMMSGGPEVRMWLESHPEVDRVLLDQRARPLPVPVPTQHGSQDSPPATPGWNLQLVGAPQAWLQGATGAGIVVGGSDSGVDGAHPALAGGFRDGGDSWYDPWEGTTTPNDANGHGTHTLASAVGGENVGVAPDAQWVACVNLDRNLGSPSYYLDCMQFMLAPFPHGGDPFTDGRPARAPHVLTNSWGCPALEGCDLTVMRPATSAFAAAGIAFVAAAGNEGPRCGSIDQPPAADPDTFAVGAVDATAEVTDFSSRGAENSGKPDLVAPGDEVLSAMPGGTYTSQSGTSMATPHVAGVIALLWSAHPDLVGDLDQTYRLLKRTSTRVGGDPACGRAETFGSGIVNAERALAELR